METAQIKQQIKSAVSISILPPSQQILVERLTRRGQDDDDTIRARMALADKEISYYKSSDFLIINDNFDVAVRELVIIIAAIRLKVDKQRIKYQSSISTIISLLFLAKICQPKNNH